MRSFTSARAIGLITLAVVFLPGRVFAKTYDRDDCRKVEECRDTIRPACTDGLVSPIGVVHLDLERCEKPPICPPPICERPPICLPPICLPPIGLPTLLERPPICLPPICLPPIWICERPPICLPPPCHQPPSVPEPTSLFALGAVALAVVRRRMA